jgi:hypothetical protein
VSELLGKGESVDIRDLRMTWMELKRVDWSFGVDTPVSRQ